MGLKEGPPSLVVRVDLAQVRTPTTRPFLQSAARPEAIFCHSRDLSDVTWCDAGIQSWDRLELPYPIVPC